MKYRIGLLGTGLTLALTLAFALAAGHKGGPLHIAIEPEDQTANHGEKVTFTVVADVEEKADKISYQWLYNDYEMPSADTHTLTVTAGTDTVGLYRCLVSQKKYVVSSEPAALFLNPTERAKAAGAAQDKDKPKTTITAATGPFQPGSGTKSCIMAYVGYTKFKTNMSSWFTPPAGATNCTITDQTANHSFKVEIIESPSLRSACNLETVQLNVVSGSRYAFTSYATNSGPSNGQPISIEIKWDP
jgi:hypothetical protein